MYFLSTEARVPLHAPHCAQSVPCLIKVVRCATVWVSSNTLEYVRLLPSSGLQESRSVTYRWFCRCFQPRSGFHKGRPVSWLRPGPQCPKENQEDTDVTDNNSYYSNNTELIIIHMLQCLQLQVRNNSNLLHSIQHILHLHVQKRCVQIYILNLTTFYVLCILVIRAGS